MFLGITYNMWHGLIPMIVHPIVVLVWVLISGFSQSTFLVATYHSLLVLFALQAANEAKQAIDSKLLIKYSSLPAFQSNSREDWKFYFAGQFLGLVWAMIIIKIWG